MYGTLLKTSFLQFTVQSFFIVGIATNRIHGMSMRRFMKLLIPFFILFFSFCNFKKEQKQNHPVSDKKETDMLLLKLYWFEGDVTLQRNNANVPVQTDLELEKDDLIKTGANGSAELLLGIDHHIKLGNHSEISVTNLLTTSGETTSSISLKSGKVLVIANADSQEEISILTPNTLANTKDSIVLAQIFPDSKKPKGTECDKNSCFTKLAVLNGKLHVKQVGNASDLLVEKKFQLTVGNEAELSQNKILPLDRISQSDAKNMLAFHATEPVVEQLIVQEYNSAQISVKPQQVSPTTNRVALNKKPLVHAQKILPKKPIAIKKPANQKKPVSKDIHRDRLKLEPNKKF
jgi:hypothetical protein